MSRLGTPTPTVKLIHYLRLMADAGGVLTRNRIRTLIESADRLEDLDERIAIMSEQDYAGQTPSFPPEGVDPDGNG